MTPDRVRKRHIIAAAVIQGVTVAAVARQLGVSRSWASREANSDGVRDLIAALIATHREAVGRLLARGLDAIAEAFAAEKKIRRSDGVWITVPDHRVRLEAVRVFCSLLACFESMQPHEAASGAPARRAAGKPSARLGLEPETAVHTAPTTELLRERRDSSNRPRCDRGAKTPSIVQETQLGSGAALKGLVADFLATAEFPGVLR